MRLAAEVLGPGLIQNTGARNIATQLRLLRTMLFWGDDH